MLIVGLFVIVIFSNNIFGLIIGGLLILGFFIWIMINNPYRDFECSNCSHSE